MKILTYSAATYNCNTYGAGTYSNTATCSTGTNSRLANTGVDFWVPLVLGAVLFLGGIALLVRRMVRTAK